MAPQKIQQSLPQDQNSSIFSLPANTRFHLNIESSEPVSIYLRKGQSDVADLYNFDTAIKNERKINLNSEMIDLSSTGAILTI